MNILLTSVGRRSYLVEYFKKSLSNKGNVYVANSSGITPAFKCADKSVVTPLIYEKNYIDFLKCFCKENNVNAIISLFDIDLPVLSKNKLLFEEIGVKVIVSDKKVVEICNDKWKTFEFLKKNGFEVPKSFLSVEDALEAIDRNELYYPVMVKPRWGMGSLSIYQADDEEELIVFYKKVQKSIQNSYLKYESEQCLQHSVIIQEKLKGKEYGLDVINDLEGKYKNTIIKQKYAMRSGETDCAITVESPELRRVGEQLATRLGHIANLDVDVFLVGNKPYVLEMNARFGGGYPFSHLAGVNLPEAIIEWLDGKDAPEKLFDYEVGILSHKDIKIVPIYEGNVHEL